nr:RNA-directed DNA polymerase, eukaryota, nucleotide-binding alpha-beta plait domain protein [Tanacetum cinerariifolium]
MHSQEYYQSQYYSIGHCSAHVNDDEEVDSPVEDVSPIKPKKPSRRAANAKKNDPNDPPKEWTVEEEIALCQAWCDVLENNEIGNSMKAKGFWDAVITYFEKKTGSSRGSFASLSKLITPDADPEIMHSQEYYQSQDYSIGHGSAHVNDDEEVDSPVEDVSPVKPKKPSRRAANAKKNDPKDPPKEWTVEEEIAQDFTLEHCYNILKDHQGWLDIEMPSFYNNAKGRKKSKTSETTSGLASGGINLDNEADEPVKDSRRKRFAFVRFIKVLNFDRLIENLKTIWIGRFHLSANPARFDRPKAPTFKKVKPVSSGNVTGFRQPNVQYRGRSNVTISTPPFLLKPTLVLDDSCLVNRDLVNCVMGVDIEGVPLNAWSRSTFQKIASKWGEMVEPEDGYDDLFARKRICIKTSQTE